MIAQWWPQPGPSSPSSGFFLIYGSSCLAMLEHLLLWFDCQLQVSIPLEDSTLQLGAHLWVYRRILYQFFNCTYSHGVRSILLECLFAKDLQRSFSIHRA